MSRRPPFAPHALPRRLPVVACALLLLAPLTARGQSARFLSQPTVSETSIVFVHANDLWTVDRAGGTATRLTSARGAETDPHVSPDGRWVAFTGQYAGNTDVYVVAAGGGQPERLTYHPGSDVAQGWTPDGDVLFRSGREGRPTMLWTFFTVPREGGLPEPLAVPQAYQGQMSADGTMLAYQEIGFWDPEWRNHRGGQAQPVSVVSTSTWERRTPPWEGERHMAPVWLDGVVYYISERDWAANVWSWDPETGEERQLTRHADFDVKSLGAGAGVVVYEQAGYLHELDPATGESRQLDVRIAGDLTWAQPRWVDVPANQLGNAGLSPTGRRAVFEHRGEIFTVPAEEGSWRNVTNTSGVADRYPSWSPDGSTLAWFNDEGGEYALVLADQDGRDPRRIPIPDPNFYYDPVWSPDGTRLAFTDTDYRVLVLDVASGEIGDVDGEAYANPSRSPGLAWSPDSRYLAYTKRLYNLLRAAFVYDTGTGETHQLTDGMADVITPQWDASGTYMYFLASTDYGLNTSWLDMSSYDRPSTRSLYLAVLEDGEPSPFLPRSDEEGEDDEDDAESGGAGDRGAQGEGAGGGDEGASGGADPQEAASVTLDIEGIASRIVDVPGLPTRDYQGLVAGPEGHVFVLEDVPGQGGNVLRRYSVEDREAEEFVDGVSTAVVSHDRRRLLVRSGSNWSIVGTDRAPTGNAGRLDLDDLRVRVVPTEEWTQMLREGWRFMRDYLYVDNAHGAPWDDVWDWYSAWLPDVGHRSDFNALLDMLSGEIAVGHSYVRGGDYPDLDGPRTGLLGADLEEADGRYRIARIYSGEGWTPGLEGPLAAPGVGVEEGDYLLAVEGRELAAPTNPYMPFEATAGRTITITVNDAPSMEGARDVLVEPVGSEGQLRSWAWVEGNRRTVDEMSDGRLAYVYLPNTGRGGYTYFNRMYFAQQDRQGAVLDERNNGGGSAADYIIEVLERELTGYFNSRTPERRPFTQPQAGLWGPKVMIINGRAGSGGDLMPYLFRFKDLGPLVGTRTWGGLVHTADTPGLLDGGRFVAPRGGFYDVNGEWAIEAEGVAPDIEVRNDPRPVIEGRDPQLERAVQEALRLLETEAVTLEPEPEPPVRYRRPGSAGAGGGGDGGAAGDGGGG